MSRFTQRLVIAMFLVFFGAPALLAIAGFETESVENRSKSDFPELELGRLLDESFYSELAGALNDRNPVRSVAIGLNARIGLAFGESPNVVVGEDGWLFLTDSAEASCVTEAEAAAVVANVELLQRAYELSGRRLVFSIGPDKASIYGENLKGEGNACIEENRATWESAFVGTSDVVLLWAPLEQASKDDLVYHVADTHWNAVGASIAVREVVDELQAGVWSDDDVTFERTREHPSDLRVLIGLPDTDPAPVASVVRDGVVSTVVNSRTVDPGFLVTDIEASATGSAAVIGGTTVLVHDSFGGAFLEIARSYFGDLRAVGSFQPGYRAVADEIAAGDTVVVMTVERELVGRLGGQGASEFLVPILADLPLRTVTIDDSLLGTSSNAIIDNGTIVTIANDPKVFLPEPISNGGILFLVLETSAESRNSVFAYWDEVANFTPDGSAGTVLLPGEYVVVLDMSDAPDGYRLRVDPGDKEGVVVTGVSFLDIP